MKMNKVNEMKELVAELNKYCDAYYNQSKSLISDFEFDQKYDQLLNMEKETGIILSNSPTQHVGYEVKSELVKTAHSHLMMSLDKTKDVNVLKKFIGDKEFVLMCKMDGLTCLITYENGELIRAETRGNGSVGELITHNAKVFDNIPLHINLPGHVEIEGEAIITYDDFEKINAKIKDPDAKYKNPRNLASGSVRQLDSKIAKQRHVKFVVWKVPAGMEQINSFNERLEKAKELGFDIVPYIHAVDTHNSMEDTIECLRIAAEEYSYPIDGMVVTYDDIFYGLSLGVTDKFPRHSLAYKFYDEEYETTLQDIEWTMGKSGVLTPTAVFDPVEIDGTSVSRASLHNVSIFKEFNLHKGDLITVYKANQIIPQVSGNITRGKGAGDKFEILGTCPICAGDTVVLKKKDSEILMCMNQCKGKLLGELCAFVGKKAHDINGLSETTLSLMIHRGLVNSPIDLYKLKEKKEQLSYLPKMGAKKISNLLKAIDDSRNTTLEKFIVGLNIPLIGSRAAKDIAKHERIRTKETNLLEPINTFIVDAAENYDFTHIEGLGVERNNSIHNYFKENYDYVCALASQFTFQDNTVESIAANTSLEGKKFCITGKLKKFANRDALVADIESKGGKVVSGVTKATDYLITNDKESGSSKNKKAAELNIPIISEDEYCQL